MRVTLDINEAVKAISNQIGVAATEIIPEYTKVIIAQKAFGTITCAIITLIAVFMIVFGLRHENDVEGRWRYSDTPVIVFAIGMIVVVFSFAFMLYFAYGLTMWMTSPTGAIVDMILEKINS